MFGLFRYAPRVLDAGIRGLGSVASAVFGNARGVVLPRLQLITTSIMPNGDVMENNEFISRVERAIEGGVDCVQYREPEPDIEVGIRLAEMCRFYGVLCIVNNHVNFARTINAGGVWLGQRNIHPEEARVTLGEEAFIGLTCDTVGDYQEANTNLREVVSALSFVINPSRTNPCAAVLSLGDIQEVLQDDTPNVQVILLGGVTPKVIRDVNDRDLGYAVCSPIMCAADPEEAAAEYSGAVKDVIL